MKPGVLYTTLCIPIIILCVCQFIGWAYTHKYMPMYIVEDCYTTTSGIKKKKKIGGKIYIVKVFSFTSLCTYLLTTLTTLDTKGLGSQVSSPVVCGVLERALMARAIYITTHTHRCMILMEFRSIFKPQSPKEKMSTIYFFKNIKIFLL